MKKLTVFLSALFLVFSVNAHANGPYVGLKVGAVYLTDSDLTDPNLAGTVLEVESDTGFSVGAAVGYGFSNNFRLEGEISYQSNDVDKISFLGLSTSTTGDSTALTFLLNGYYDFKNNSPLTPFITGGLGYSKVELNDFNLPGSGLPNINEDDNVFAYQVGVGLAYEMTEKATFDIGYRYFATEDPELDTSEVEFQNHILYLGLRYSF
ncbi:MAG: porin family protein [Desulfobacterales bacterium]|nr:porin family protein [Desulfobacterales bacterium]